jgi:TPR repeat protein
VNTPPSAPPKAADNGDAEFATAERYLREKSGPGSSAAAANSLWAAVKKGNISAEIALADLYARGDGVTKNCDQARVLLRAAAQKGSSIASQQLAQVIRSGCR